MKLPTRSQRARAAVIVFSEDLKRIANRFHSRLHRGCVFAYAVLSHQVYLVGMFRDIQDVCRNCVHCNVFFEHNRRIECPLENILGTHGPSEYFIDLVGPISGSAKATTRANLTSKSYVIVIYCPCTGFLKGARCISASFQTPAQQAARSGNCSLAFA